MRLTTIGFSEFSGYDWRRRAIAEPDPMPDVEASTETNSSGWSCSGECNNATASE